jgi:hypothetical protein
MTTTLPLPVESAYRPSRPVRYMLAGAVVGLIAAILLTFVLALFDGQAQGMSAGNCVVYGCVLTVLLSQMAGFSGMAVGAGVGALAGGVVHVVRDRFRTR